MCIIGLLPSPLLTSMSQASTQSVSIFGRRIVFFGAAEDVSEPTLLQLFSQHGNVTGLFLVRSALGLPSGCGYVTMATAEQAKAAVSALQGSTECAEPGSKLGLLIVQPPEQHPADGQQHQHQQHEESGAGQAAKDSRTVFFTKVPPTVTTHQLIQLFTACGEVIHVELFTPWPGAKISKGCGLVEFARGDAAAAAVDSLHQAFTWPHSHSPLVVEWLDSKRQAANRASKLCKQSSSDGAAGPIRRALTVPMDRNATSAAGLATSAVYSSPAGAAYASAPGQLGTQQHPQHGSRSCPLPRLQPAAAGAWVPAAYAAYMHPGMLPQVHEQADYSQQQQQGDAAAAAAAIAASGAYWWPLHPVSSGTASATSTYDNSGSMAGLTASSTLSNSSTVMQLAPADMSASSLACFSVSSAAVQLGNTTEYSQQDMASFRGCQSPVAAAATSLAMAATAALGAGRSHPAWQQLQQQNIMLLQPISNPMEDVGAAGAAGSRLLPAASSGFAAERQALQMSSAAAAAAAGGGGAVYTSLPAASGSLPQQQLAYAQLAACSRPLQQQQQQQLRWWSGYQQAPAAAAAAPAGSDECMIMLPLSARQLQVMSAVLPEVPRLTGAKALLSGCSIGSGVQLVVTGQASEVRAAHSVVAMLITNLGVDEPLLPAGMTQQQR